jgi:predicted transcriptional regulator
VVAQHRRMATRLLLPDIVEHPVRSALLDLIRVEPGIPFLGLYDQMKAVPEFAPRIAFGSLSYHLQQLERFGLITTRKSGRHRRHYVNGGAWGGDTTSLSILQGEPAARLARAILARPGLQQSALWQVHAQARPCTRQSVGYHLARFERHQLAAVVRRGSSKRYFPTEKLSRLVAFLDGRRPPPAAAMAAFTAMVVPA